ncbi:MAG: aldo/keto reductase [Chloroflexi bacterium]|nr:aldo/keto reductase [Chloroflexota bacterium]
MKYTRLGRSGLKVSRICLGTNMLGGYVDEEASIRVVDACMEHGVNFIDTADSYNAGRSEEVLGKAMKGRRKEIILATKVYSPQGQGINDRGASRKHIMDGVAASLRRLQTDYIDLYQIHFWDAETPLEETLRTLDDLVRRGMVRYIGCSNFAAWQLCKALWVSDKLGLERFESVQPSYNFMHREIERELLPACLDQQVGVIPYQVLMSGMFAGRYREGEAPPPGSRMAERPQSRERNFRKEIFGVAEKLGGLAQQSGHTPAQLTLAWALANPAITSVIAGASKPEQVAQNAKVADITLSPEEVAACNAV